MGKGSFIAIVALLVAVAGAIVAFAAFFKRRNAALYEDIDDDMMDDDMFDVDYYTDDLEDEEDAEYQAATSDSQNTYERPVQNADQDEIPEA